MFSPGEVVATKNDHPSCNLTAGDQGIIVFVYDETAYEVNFFDGDREWRNIWLAEELTNLGETEPIPFVAARAVETKRWLATLE